jgi:hypothetical protein
VVLALATPDLKDVSWQYCIILSAVAAASLNLSGI